MVEPTKQATDETEVMPSLSENICRNLASS